MEELTTLVRRAQDGDTDAYNTIVVRFQDMAMGYAYALLKDFHLAQDAAQDAFVAAYQELPKLEAPEAFASWFRRIVFKYCDRFTRKKQYEMVEFDDTQVISQDKNPMEHLETQELKTYVLNAIHALPQEQRQVTTLFYISEYTHTEIAAFLNIPFATVNNRLRAARKRLKKGMITMTKDTLKKEAPSQNDQFARKIAQMIKPISLKTTAYLQMGKGRGEDIWAMICAAIEGDLTTIQRLISQTPTLAQCEYNYTQPIHFAVREGHKDVVRFLLNQGTDPSYRTYDFRDSLVTLASDRGHHKIVKMLEAEIQRKSQGFDAQKENLAIQLLGAISEQNYTLVSSILDNTPESINLGNSDGTTPLHRAVETGDFYMVRYLIAQGANLNAIGGSGSGSGRKPIHLTIYASKRHQPKLFQNRLLLIGYLLANGAEYNMLIAAALGDLQQVSEFLETDPSLANFRDTCNRMPISIAARWGYKEIVETLLAHGADPNAPEPHAPNGCALLDATFHGHIEIAKLLLEHGADPNANIDSTGSAVKFARKYPDLYALMLENGGQENDVFDDAVYANDLDTVSNMLKSDPSLAKNPNGFHGEGILSGIAQKGYMDMIKLLMEYGATVPDTSKWGASYYFKHYDIAKHLLENGMNPNHQNWLGITLLHNFAKKGNIEKAELLLDFGANIHAKDTECCTTPLGIAAREGQQDMVEFLLKRGSKTNLPDDEPWATPLAWANRRGHTTIADILRKHGATA